MMVQSKRICRKYNNSNTVSTRTLPATLHDEVPRTTKRNITRSLLELYNTSDVQSPPPQYQLPIDCSSTIRTRNIIMQLSSTMMIQQQRLFLQRLFLVPFLLFFMTTMVIMTSNAYTTTTGYSHWLHHHPIQAVVTKTSFTIPQTTHNRHPSFIVAERYRQQRQQQRITTILLSSSDKDGNDTINGGSDANSVNKQKQYEDDAKKMKVGELKQLLESQGISTKTYIEKSEFIKAYVQYMMKGGSSSNKNTSTSSSSNKKTTSSSSSASSSSSSNKQSSSNDTKDPSYRDVVVYKMNRSDPRMLQGTMIDITIPKK